jgi:hypothetical protein
MDTANVETNMTARATCFAVLFLGKFNIFHQFSKRRNGDLILHSCTLVQFCCTSITKNNVRRLAFSEVADDVKDDHGVLTGNTAEVYRYAIKQRKPVGVREVQRALKLSSPTLAAYHLDKLEEAGLLKQTSAGYVVEKLVLENFVRLRQLLLPKYLFYLAVFFTAVVFQATLFRPPQLTREYVFSTSMLVLATAYFAYETVMTTLKKRI